MTSLEITKRRTNDPSFHSLLYGIDLSVVFTNIDHLTNTTFCIDAKLFLGGELVATKIYSYEVTANAFGQIVNDQNITETNFGVFNGGLSVASQVS